MAPVQQAVARTLVTAIAGLALMGASLVGSAAPASAAFKFTRVVDTSVPVPGGGGALFYLTLGFVPAVSGSHVVFNANYDEVWTATTTGTTKRKVINPVMAIPGSGGTTFHQDYGTFVQIHGDTVVLVGLDCDGCNSGYGLYTVPVGGGTRTRLADVKMKRPDDNTQKFGRFGDDFHVNGSHVVFANSAETFAVPIAGGTVTYVTGGGTSCLDSYCFDGLPTLDSLDAEVFLKAGNGLSNARLQLVKRAGGFVGTIASGDTHPPATPATYRFDEFFGSFDLPVIDRTADHNYRIFKGESTDGSGPRITGIYSRGSAGFIKLADTRTPVPLGTGKFTATGFVDSGSKSLAAANGIVIFRGVDAAGKLGIYAVRATGGTITKIIAQGDPINGTTVDTGETHSLVFRREGFDGTTLVFMAQYAGNTGRGIFSTTVTLP